jgi:hypothetical protein
LTWFPAEQLAACLTAPRAVVAAGRSPEAMEAQVQTPEALSDLGNWLVQVFAALAEGVPAVFRTSPVNPDRLLPFGSNPSTAPSQY